MRTICQAPRTQAGALRPGDGPGWYRGQVSARSKALSVSTRNASFQQWQALLTNRTKRHRTGRFLVHGVRPITMALRYGWPVEELLVRGGARSDWLGRALEDAGDAVRYELSPELMAELGEKDEAPPELILVAAVRPDDTDRLPVRPDGLYVALDRPASPGNLGAVIRSADALGAHGVLVAGHAADPYDPRTIRATTGSFFAVPTVRCDGAEAVLDWAASLRARGIGLRVVGTAEHGAADLAATDLTGPTLLVIGNETHGLSAAWTAGVDVLARIPMTGSASSLNAAVSASICLYEAMRQRLAR
jgi:23S rRNA (uridine2479-2'-O)-methyltransferase